MRRIDPIELVAGGILIALGLWYASFALAEYSYGSARRMGPGYFPTWVGLIIAGLGVTVVLLGFAKRGEWPRLSLRPMIAILAGCFGFAAVVEVLGLVPAVFALVLIATLSESPYRIPRTLVLAACLSAIAVVVFSWGLGIPFVPFRWSF
jgi:hypothetical protein